jgi:transcriptional regulator with XRE-family HTH domain
MANEKLRQALQDAGLTPDQLADIVQVDVRSVRRWLSGGTPYPRQRAKVARALDTNEHQLWPGIATAATNAARPQPSDLIAAYLTADALDAPDWKTLIRDATHQIDLLGHTLELILNTPGATELLAAKAAAGCHIRVLLTNPRRCLRPLIGQPAIEVRLLDITPRQTIHRYDNQLLLHLQLIDQDDPDAPLLHLHRAAAGGLFDRITEHYTDLWEHNALPLDPDSDLHDDADEHDEDEVEPAGANQPADLEPTDAPAERAGAGTDASRPVRRWPGRPD